MTEQPKLVLAEMLVLAAIYEINDRQMPASDLNILTILELTEILTGVDLKCPEILDPDAIVRACQHLETIGYLSNEDKTALPAGDGDPAAAWTADALTPQEYELRRRAIEFGAEVTEKLSRDQYGAVFTLVLCRTVGRMEGWLDDEGDLMDMVAENLPKSLEEAARGQLIAETMKEIWERQQPAGK